MKTSVAMISHNLKALYPEPAPQISGNSGKIEKLREVSVMKCIFNKIACILHLLLELDYVTDTFLYPLRNNLRSFLSLRREEETLKYS